MSEISREVYLQELVRVEELLREWIEAIETPRIWEKNADGVFLPVKVCSPAPGLSINQIEGIPVAQLRAELLLCSQKLEALASL